MKFSEMNKRQLKEVRDELGRRMYKVLGTSRVMGLTDRGVTILGGVFPANYDAMTEELAVWGRGSRNSGGSMTVAQLEIVEAEVQNFFDEYLGGE